MSAEDFDQLRDLLEDLNLTKALDALARLEARMAGLERERDEARASLDFWQAGCGVRLNERDEARAEVERLRGYVEKLKLDISGHVGVIHQQHDHIERLRAAIRRHKDAYMTDDRYDGDAEDERLWAALEGK